MKKLLQFVDTYLLKIGVLFTMAFLALYPKLPTIHIIRTWVYIRLEDFSIAVVAIIWFILLLRRKVKLPLPVGIPLGIYWLVGFCSVIYTILFIGSHLVGFFPHLVILEYGRRIEYMILFFVAFSTIRNWKDVRDYVVVLILTLIGVVIYGFGQQYYLNLWSLFPKFFEKYSFCFPSFQTGNEQFAKGIALCLPTGARITSTFGGHYDLAAYLVIVLPILIGLFLSVKNKIYKWSLVILFILSLSLLLFTASRVSFFSYIVGAIATLIFMKRKKWLIPVLGISFILLLVFSGSTAKRLLETFRVVNVITNTQGQVVGVAATNLPSSLQNKISKSDSVVVEAPPPTQNLPTGSSYITLASSSQATSTALVTNSVSSQEALKLKLANGGLQISTVSGSFLIQKALVYDISFTTRFQAEWPNAWAAFISHPILGQGYSTITLATDNDYLRLLGESGVLGFLSFFLIFIVLGLFLTRTMKDEHDPFLRAVAFGLAGGTLGLFANASLIDVFESSKVAETFWILLGVGVGALSIRPVPAIDYLGKLKKVVTSHIFLIAYLLIGVGIVFAGGINTFFVADDFVWLKWAATTTPHDFLRFFINAQGFFYRPIDRIVMYLSYQVFSFDPQGYHILGLVFHGLIGVGVYILGLQLLKKRTWAWLLAAVYIILPIHAEVLFWMATISNSLSTLFVVFGLVCFVAWRQRGSIVFYILAVLLSLLGVFSYEGAVIAPVLFFATDAYLSWRQTKKHLIWYIPFVLVDVCYLILRFSSHVAAIGGDYSYSLAHLIPNLVANYIGYGFTAFFGERVIAYQEVIRNATKPYALPIGIVLLIIILGTLALLWRARTKVTRIIRDDRIRLFIFGLVFAFIALLPFLPLGALSERYGYFAALGFVMSLIALLQLIFMQADTKQIIVGIILAALLFFGFTSLINEELAQWQKAGTITFDTLAYFRVVQEGLTPGSTIYVVNMPTRYGNAWIFPVGLPEGLWFIYRDENMTVVSEPSIVAAKQAAASSTAHTYIFSFDKQGNITQVQ